MLYTPKYKPFEHQREGTKLLIDNRYFALFDEMGTGKTKTVIDAMNSLYCYTLDVGHDIPYYELHAVVVVCPNQVKAQWSNPEWGQIVKHTPESVPFCIYRIDSNRSQRKWLVYDQECEEKLIWIVVNYEALRVARISQFLNEFMQQHKTAMVLDESIYIKNHVSQQTKACYRLGQLAVRRYILNGTPLTKGPLDYFSQFKFLHPDIIGIPSYAAFRNRYAIMGGYQVNGRAVQVVGYQNLDDLINRIKPFYRRLTKEDCLDLPKKLYKVVEVSMTPKQDALYQRMKDNFLVFVGGKVVHAPIVLTKLLRLSQLSSGFITDNQNGEEMVWELPESPKINMAVTLVKESIRPVVIFCMYKQEIKMLASALKEEGISFGEIHGEVKIAERERCIEEFQAERLKVVICQVATGGLGIELYKAGLVIRLTNPYSHAIQMQAEDRVHRTGLQHNVTYVDILSTRHKGGTTIDHGIYRAHIKKKDLIDTVLNEGDWDGKI